jgi:hypothetical protein
MWRQPIVLGLGALAIAALSIVVGPPTWLTIAAVGTSTILLAMDSRLGWLGAGLVVAIALPYGRGADVVPLELGGLPLRPPDAAIGIALLGAIISLRPSPISTWHRSRRVAAIGLLLLLAVGVVALGMGVLEGHQLRDVARDVRFWLLYGGALVALVGSTPSSTILRGLLLGTTAFCVIIVAATLLPAFTDGLKDQVLAYDRGTLRMQFGNSIFLIPALAYVLHAFLRRPAALGALWVLTMTVSIGLSLTRMSILATLLVIALVMVVWAAQHRYAIRVVARPLGTAIATVTLGLVLAVTGASIAQAPGSTDAGEDQLPEGVLDRMLGQSDQSDLGAIMTSRTGRMATYLTAYALIMDHMPAGAGLGQLVPTLYAYSEARAATIGLSPGVDNTYLTFGVKAGVAGMAAIAAFLLLPLWMAMRRESRGLASWFAPAWVGILVLSMTQAFASSGYGPFGLALLAVVPALRARSVRGRPPA